MRGTGQDVAVSTAQQQALKPDLRRASMQSMIRCRDALSILSSGSSNSSSFRGSPAAAINALPISARLIWPDDRNRIPLSRSLSRARCSTIETYALGKPSPAARPSAAADSPWSQGLQRDHSIRSYQSVISLPQTLLLFKGDQHNIATGSSPSRYVT